MACIGVMPRATMMGNWRALSPCGNTPASVANTMGTPASTALVNAWRWISVVSTFLRRNSSGQSGFPAFGVDVVAVVDIHGERHVAALARGRDAGVVEIGRVLDGVDAGGDGHAYRFGAMRMRRHLLADGVRDVDHGGDVLARHLGLAGHAAKCEHRARGNHLEQVRAVVDQELRALAEAFRVARDAGVKTFVVGGFLEVGDVEVATAMRNREVRAAGLHARPERLCPR